MPIYEMRNDGRGNLMGALMIAGQFYIPEVSGDVCHAVCVCVCVCVCGVSV